MWLGLQHMVQIHYCGEYGHIGENCIKHHMRKRDTTKRFCFCIKLGHLSKKCMNMGRIEVEKKDKAEKIKK